MILVQHVRTALSKLLAGQSFGEDVGDHVFCTNKERRDDSYHEESLDEHRSPFEIASTLGASW